MDESKNSHDTPAAEAGVPQISPPPPVAPSYSDFDAHHFNNNNIRHDRSQLASRSSDHNQNDDYWREAVELDEMRSHRPSSVSTASISSGECRASHSFRVITQASTIRPDDGPFRMLRKFWLRNVVLTVPHNKNRDHFGMPFPGSFPFKVIVNFVASFSCMSSGVLHLFHILFLFNFSLPLGDRNSSSDDPLIMACEFFPYSRRRCRAKKAKYNKKEKKEKRKEKERSPYNNFWKSERTTLF